MKRIFTICIALLFSLMIHGATIYVYVHNVNGDLVSGAQVKLYNADWSQVIGIAYTNSSGYATFALLDYGTYNYEVRYVGLTTEFWGSDEGFYLGSPTLTRNFYRDWPYHYSNNLPLAPIIVNQQASIQITVKSNLSYSRSVKVELWLDRNHSSPWDFHQLSSAKTVNGGGTKTFTFNYWPSNTGNYDWKAYIWTYNDGAGDYIVTDTYPWDFAFNVYQPVGDIFVNVHNINGNLVEGAEVKLYDDNWNLEEIEYTNSSGQAQFFDYPYGDYNYEVFYTNEVPEFWGSDEDFSLNSSSITRQFTRNWPYHYSNNLPLSSVNAGQQVTIQIVVKNDLTYSRNVKVDLWLDRNQIDPWDYHQLSSSQLIGGGGTQTFYFNVTPTYSGIYYWKAHIKSYNDGASDYIVTDTHPWSSAFTAENTQSLPISSGQIIFHRYTEYNAMDSELYLYNFQNNSLQVISASWDINNAMNAHFSPDGSKIVFMAIPSTIYNYNSWNVYLWEISSPDPPTLLTNNSNIPDEDPKFSPTGDSIVFKQNKDIKIMDLNGNILCLVTNNGSAVEESMPYFTSDGNQIIYSRNDGSQTDIYIINTDGSNNQPIENVLNIDEYYPITKDQNTFLYSRWISSSNSHDQVYQGFFSGNDPLLLDLNDPLSENADAYPAETDYAFFSSTRIGGMGEYDLYIANLNNGSIWDLNSLSFNSPNKELGACYSNPNPPGPPTADPATNILQTSFDANWTAATTGDPATGYFLDVATDNTFSNFVSGYENLDVGNVTTYSVTGLNSNTDYYYRVRSYNAGGTSGNSNTINTTTLPFAPDPPTADPATNILQTSFDANWTAATTGDPATGYYFDVATDNTFNNFVSGYENLDVGNVTIYNVTGLNSNTDYYYRVRSYNAGGTSGNSNTINTTTLPFAPDPPTADPATNILQTSFDANWTAATTGDPATGYYFDVATDNTFNNFVSGYENLDVGNVTIYNVTGLNSNTDYYYRVRGYNAIGTSGNSNTVYVTTLMTSIDYTTDYGIYIYSFNNQIIIKSKKDSFVEGEFIIYDMLGRPQTVLSLPARKRHIIECKLKSGIYIIYYQSGDKVYTSKIIIF